MAKLICPFCGEEVKVVVCDDEGNVHDDDYENDPWSGLGYQLEHVEKEGVYCPIATEEYATLGRNIYDSREEAKQAWLKRAEPFFTLPGEKFAITVGYSAGNVPNYLVEHRNPVAEFYKGQWHFGLEPITYREILEEYDTKEEALARLNDLMKRGK